MDRREHWEAVYQTKPADTVSWYEATPDTSLELVDACAPDVSTGILDVGGGASAFVDGILERGHTDVSVLDVSAQALEIAKARLGRRAAAVTWLVADVTRWEPGRTFGVWHDRAVFHFLGEARDRAAYRSVLERSVEPGGWVIMGTFGPDGPRRCSGLDVKEYSGRALAAELGDGFVLERSFTRIHTTPSGVEQQFQWAVLRRS
jgi:SAM-dependent methyltransferase